MEAGHHSHSQKVNILLMLTGLKMQKLSGLTSIFIFLCSMKIQEENIADVCITTVETLCTFEHKIPGGCPVISNFLLGGVILRHTV